MSISFVYSRIHILMYKDHEYKVTNTMPAFFQLEQMELEIKDLPAKDKQKYRTRLASYKAENKKLMSDMVNVVQFVHAF